MATFPEIRDLCSPKRSQVPVQTHAYVCTQIRICTQLIPCTMREIRREKGPSYLQVNVDVCMQATGEFNCSKYRHLKTFGVYFLNI